MRKLFSAVRHLERVLAALDLVTDATAVERFELQLELTNALKAASDRRFYDAGFAAASGAIGQCANGPVEYPQVLSMWSQGHTFKDSVNKGDDPSTRRIFDAAAWLSGFRQANSDKEIRGNLTVTIDSLP